MMKFTKMHGTGNDYVYVNCFEESVKDPSAMAIAVSHRRFGIGSDGLILIRPHADADAEMEMYNADGSLSEMCGNGLRCVAKYVFDHGIAKKKELCLMTGDGLKYAVVHTGDNGLVESVRLDMGTPGLSASEIPSTWTDKRVVNKVFRAGDREFKVTCLNMGNPHCVIYVDNVDEFAVEKYGKIIENSPVFPARVNVEFVQVLSTSEVRQRTWERGSGETWACGTGASAVCVAGFLTGKTEKNLKVRLLGGELQLEYDGTGPVMMSGSAVEVFRGEFPDSSGS